MKISVKMTEPGALEERKDMPCRKCADLTKVRVDVLVKSEISDASKCDQAEIAQVFMPYAMMGDQPVFAQFREQRRLQLGDGTAKH